MKVTNTALIALAIFYSPISLAEDILMVCNGQTSIGYQVVNGVATFSNFNNPGTFYIVMDSGAQLLVKEDRSDIRPGYMQEWSQLTESHNAYVSTSTYAGNPLITKTFSVRKSDGIFVASSLDSLLKDPSQRQTVSLDTGVCSLITQ